MFEDDKMFAEISLAQISKSFLGKSDAGEIITVPGFQRNAVWKETKVEDLWDSLLCRFPIGSILLARYGDFSEVGDRPPQLNPSELQPDTIIDNKGGGFIVVDGQQRLNAISVGFVPYESVNTFRLWVDLGTSGKFPNRIFQFYLCTQDNPFGAGLSKQEKRLALASIDKEEFDDSQLSLKETCPYWAKAPVPFYEFCRILEKTTGLGEIRNSLTNPDEAKLSEALIQKVLKPKYATVADITQLVKAIQDVVIDGNYKIPAVLVEKRGDFMTPKMLGKLFERVNLGGERPPTAEIFYSALKLRAPRIGNFVAHIYNDPVVGKLFKSTDIVLNALRIVDPQTVELKLEDFEKIAPEPNKEAGPGEESKLSKLLTLMNDENNASSDFHGCVQLAYQALHHNGQKGEGDIGLPRQLLGRLRPRVWHTITWWIHENLETIRKNGAIDSYNRLNIIRYAMLDSLNYFLVWTQSGGRKSDIRQYNKDGISRQSINSLEGNTAFAVQQILADIRPTGQDIKFEMLTPEQFKDKLRPTNTPDIPQGYAFSNEDVLLMFAQRDYLQTWEPYDLEVDHVAPSTWMFFRAGPTPVSYFWRVSNVQYWQRYYIQNSIGNKRYWPEALNAGDQDTPPGEKLCVVTDKRRTWKFDTQQKIQEASFIQDDLLDDWKSLSTSLMTGNDHRIWTPERFSTFKRLIDERRYLMYKHMYETLGFQELAVIMQG